MVASNPVHVIPQNDTCEHQKSARCWCQPSVSDAIIVHNAADGREFLEKDDRQALLAALEDAARGCVCSLEKINAELTTLYDRF